MKRQTLPPAPLHGLKAALNDLVHVIGNASKEGLTYHQQRPSLAGSATALLFYCPLLFLDLDAPGRKGNAAIQDLTGH